MTIPTTNVTCPRCAESTGRPLGNAGSLLTWYTCTACHHVWAAGVPPQAAPQEPLEPEVTSDPRQHVLVVDDDSSTLSIVERVLAKYRVSTARDGSEALAFLSTVGRVDLLITDYLMPEMTGHELASLARVARPEMCVLAISGHGHTLVEAEPAWWAAEAHLDKPFRMEALLAAVEKLIGPPR